MRPSLNRVSYRKYERRVGTDCMFLRVYGLYARDKRIVALYTGLFVAVVTVDVVSGTYFATHVVNQYRSCV